MIHAHTRGKFSGKTGGLVRIEKKWQLTSKLPTSDELAAMRGTGNGGNRDAKNLQRSTQPREPFTSRGSQRGRKLVPPVRLGGGGEIKRENKKQRNRVIGKSYSRRGLNRGGRVPTGAFAKNPKGSSH